MAKPNPRKTLSPEEQINLARVDLTYAASLLHKPEHQARLLALSTRDRDALRESVAEVLDLVESLTGEPEPGSSITL